MAYFNKKILQAITLLLVILIGDAYGSYKEYNYADNSSYVGEDYQSTANLRCEDNFTCQPTSCGCRGFVTAEVLYWRAFESGLDRCVPTDVSDTITSDGRVISIFNGRSRNPHYNWEPGFRIGVGFGYPGSTFDLSATWTHFLSNRGKNDNNQLRWNVNLDVLDILASYKYDLRCSISLTPFVGIRGAKIDQKLRIGDTDLSTLSSSFSSSSFSSSPSLSSSSELIVIDHKQKFTGVGPLIGLEADWNFGCVFSFYAKTSVSWLYGDFDVRLREVNETEDTLDICRVRKRPEAILAGTDAAFGIRLRKCFCRNTQIVLQLGLEHHRYYDYNQFGDCGDLSFDGASFSVAFEY